MENLIAEGKSIIEDVNEVTYEETVDRANNWLTELESYIADQKIIDEIYEVAARTLKPRFINHNPFVAPPMLNQLEEKVTFFQQKMGDIINILEQQNLTF